MTDQQGSEAGGFWSDDRDLEVRAVRDMLIACRAWLEAQKRAQPESIDAINAHICTAAELRIEITTQLGTRYTSVRAVTLDAEGNEVVLIRALNAYPSAPIAEGKGGYAP
jgi:hypothetical protein